jgi:hypothetical protein
MKSGSCSSFGLVLPGDADDSPIVVALDQVDEQPRRQHDLMRVRVHRPGLDFLGCPQEAGQDAGGGAFIGNTFFEDRT